MFLQNYIFHILLSFKEKHYFYAINVCHHKKGGECWIKDSIVVVLMIPNIEWKIIWIYFYSMWKIFLPLKSYFHVFISVNIFTEVTCSALWLYTFKLMISIYIFYLSLMKYQKYFYGWKVTTMFLHRFVFSSK